MPYCSGSGFELLSDSAVIAVCHDSNAFLAELQKAFNLAPGKIFKVCMNLPQNVVKSRIPQ